MLFLNPLLLIGLAGVLGLWMYGMWLAPRALTPVNAAIWLAVAATFFGGLHFGIRQPRVEVGADGVQVWWIWECPPCQPR